MTERNLADEFMPPSARIGEQEARRCGLMAPAPEQPHRRLADRLLDEGALVAQSYVEQDRWDPARPTLGVLVAEALAAAERRGEERAQAARAADRDALLDLVGAVELLAVYGHANLRAAAARARRHLDRTEGP